jgi:hypothetical protein
MIPWHEEDDSRKIFNFQQRTLIQLIKHLEDNDINFKSYCTLICVVSDYDKYERPALLFGQRNHWIWFKRFREYAKTRSMVDDVSCFILKFVELQVKHLNRAIINPNSIIGNDVDGSKKAFVTYHRIVDRINQLNSFGINYIDWIEYKFDNCVKFKPKDSVLIKTIVNHNGLDPNLDELKNKVNDQWREIRKFLNLSDECEFADGFIPKGWSPSQDDFSDTKKITVITGDGFYFYPNGEQRKGKRHYASNTYLGIKCDPLNFHEFIDSWHKTSMLVSTPTWEEYRKYSMYPGRWDDVGEPILGRGKSVKWRKSD